LHQSTVPKNILLLNIPLKMNVAVKKSEKLKKL